MSHLDFRGHQVSAPVITLPPAAGVEVGAYAAWLPLDGATAYGTGDIGDVVALDSTGRKLGTARQAATPTK
jgi:hypothetical protein